MRMYSRREKNFFILGRRPADLFDSGVGGVDAEVESVLQAVVLVGLGPLQ
jgi:hypothetical protein